MSSVGSLTIEMAANIARLQTDMNEARRLVGGTMGDIKRLADDANRSMRALEGAIGLAKTALVAYAGVASLNALKGIVTSAIDGAAALKDLSQATGASVSSLSAMGAVGKLSDTSLQTIAGGMNKLSKAMAGSNEDSKGAAAAIRALGINYDSFAKLNPDQRMQAVAKAMDGFADGSGKTAAAMALFGKQGAELLPFLNDLAEKQELVGKVTAEQAEMADRYSDNLKKLNTSGKAWQKELAMGLLPVLDETTQALLGVFNGSGGLREQIGKLAADGTLARWGRDAVTALSVVVDGVQYAIRFIGSLGEYIGATVADAAQMFGGIGEAIKRVLAGDFKGAVAEMQAIGTRTAAINADLAASINSSWDAKTMGQNLRERITQIQKLGAVAAAAKEKLPFEDKTGGAGTAPAGPAGNPFAAEQDAAKAWAKLLEDMGKLADEASAKTDGLGKAQARLLEYLKSPAYATNSESMRQVALASAYAAIAAEQLGAAEQAAAKWAEEAAKANADAVDALDKVTHGLQDQLRAQLEANAQMGLSELAIAGLQAAKLEDAAATAEQRAQWAASSDLGDDIVAQYTAQAAALRALADAKRAGAFAKDAGQQEGERQKTVDQFLGADVGTSMAAGFDKASQSLGVFTSLFAKLIDQQDQYNKAKTAAAGHADELAAIESKQQLQQINAYGNLAGAAKGFFKEHTAGYKLMEAGEKTFRAIELAMAVRNAMEKLGLIALSSTAVVAGQQVETGAVVEGEAARNAAKVPGVFMAFMSSLGPWGIAAAAAAIAAIGLSASSHGGGGFAATNDGTGTVFGDPGAKSKSIENSLKLLGDVNTSTMRYSGLMLAALQSIDSKSGGVANVLLRNGSITTGGDLGIAQFNTKANGDPLLNKIGIDSTKGLGEGLINALGLGGVLDKLQSLWGGTSQTIDKAGVDIGGKLADVIGGRGMSRFADVTTTEKSFFGLSKDTSNSTITAALDPAIAKQFGLILGSFTDFVRAAAGPLGASLDDVKAKLGAFVVDIGRVDLKGLTGQELQDKLSAVLGAQGDKIVRAALPGLEAFAKVGEGYLETVTRVATATDVVRTTLDSLGQSTAALSGLMIDRATAALGLIQAFGGQDKFLSSTSAYLQAYYSDAERAAITTKQLAGAFAGMGMALPKTLADYRKLVEAQDLSTAAGRDTYASLLSLSGVFADLSKAVADASSSVQDEIARLRGTTGADASTQGAAALQARFAVATGQARAGDQAALASLPEISKALETAAAATAGSALDNARLRAWLANSLTETLTTLGLKVPGFAAGGDFAGGLRLVGENGPELQVTGPARIYNAQQTQAMLAGAGSGADSAGALLDEVRGLRGEVAGLRAEQQISAATVAMHTRRSAQYLERVVDGADAVRTTAV